MRIKQLEYLIALKQYGSILKTSQEIFVAQPSISAAIRDLEEELGYSLLNRSNKGVVFTPKGEQVLEKAVLIMNMLDEIRALRFDPVEMISGCLKIGCGSRFCRSIVIDTCIALHESYPDLLINIKRKNVFDIIQDITSSNLDLGLIQIDAIEDDDILSELQNKNIFSSEIFRDEIVFVANAHHPLRGKKHVSLSQILQYPYVTAKEVVSPTVKNLFCKYGYQGEIVYIDDVAGMRQFIEQSTAVTYMTKSAAKKDNQIYNNNFILLSVADFDWYCSIAWIHTQRPLSILEQIITDEIMRICFQYK